MGGKRRKNLENLACVDVLVIFFSSFISLEGLELDNDSKMLEGQAKVFGGCSSDLVEEDGGNPGGVWGDEVTGDSVDEPGSVRGGVTGGEIDVSGGGGGGVLHGEQGG